MYLSRTESTILLSLIKANLFCGRLIPPQYARKQKNNFFKMLLINSRCPTQPEILQFPYSNLPVKILKCVHSSAWLGLESQVLAVVVLLSPAFGLCCGCRCCGAWRTTYSGPQAIFFLICEETWAFMMTDSLMHEANLSSTHNWARVTATATSGWQFEDCGIHCVLLYKYLYMTGVTEWFYTHSHAWW